MKKRIFFGLIFSLVIMTTVSLFSVSALGEAIFSIPDGAVETGKNFTVSIEFTSTSPIANVQTQIAYDSKLLQFVSGDGITGGNGILTLNGTASDVKSATFSITFMGVDSGTADISLANCSMLSADGTPIGSPTAYANISLTGDAVVNNGETASQTTLATVNTDTSATSSEQTTTQAQTTTASGMPSQGVLTNLTVDNGTLSPAFAYNVYDYTVNVDYSVNNVEIEGTTASYSDYIWYTGDSACAVGNNVRTITVTDTDGVETTYTITIIRAEEGEAVGGNSENNSSKTGNNSELSSSDGSSKEDTLASYKQVLNPALIIVLIVLVVSLVIIILWIRKSLFNKDKKNIKKK